MATLRICFQTTVVARHTSIGLYQPSKEERSVPLKALNCKLDMPGSIDIACERAIPCQRGTYRELAADIPLVLLHGDIHACGGVHARVMDGTAVCPDLIWINGGLLTGL